MARIALLNQKGGVGKTTTTFNVGSALARRGFRVLLVDLDPQAHLTYHAGIPAHELELTLLEVLTGEATLSEVVCLRNEHLHLVPANLALSRAQKVLSEPGAEFALKEALDGHDGYDFVLMDCPPQLGILSVNALVAATGILVPVYPEFLSLAGLSQLLQTTEIVTRRLNPRLKLSGILITNFDQRKNLHHEAAQSLRERFPELLFRTFIRTNVALAEAPSYGQSIFEYAPNSIGAQDYEALTVEFLERLQPKEMRYDPKPLGTASGHQPA
ncbi:MAG: ParA family protein [Bacteroidetes bacterium]|nr:ParA family protein [Rhodothermia bacterium]MCS7155602.1 ParA family protein [Bacteroidota bacterium]MCX7906460.1 ParA family protein [Bacteroidota bacterium]MDW8137258.1 ParA family protein [Bacteroidota bacterium]MDW8284872.1 ParA family protein [Bacteroidota bacterium]